MNELDFIFRRRSIRKFTNQLVPESLIDQLLQAAMAAPTAVNLKPWAFIVVQEAKRLSLLRDAMMFGKMNAPCAIVVCGDLRSVKRIVADKFWVQDLSAATENILLAAPALGLGAVWCGVHPIQRHIKLVSQAVELTPAVLPLAVVFVGYPDEDKPARTQYDAAKVHREILGKEWTPG